MDPFTTMRDALEMSFPEVARLHDKIISDAVKAYADGQDKPRDNPTTAKGVALSRLANAVKAIMFVNFPVAAREWHGEEQH